MKVSLICGSHRKVSESAKVSRFIERTVNETKVFDEVFHYNLGGNPLPLWDETFWEDNPKWHKLIDPIRKELVESDALILVSPEWHGAVPAGLKNFLLFWTKGEIAHKPAFIVTLSIVDGGSYPVAELRMSSYKNSRVCYIPEHLIVRYVEKVFNEDPTKNDPSAQEYFVDRLNYDLKLLREYANAFKQIRASGAADLSVYTSGM